jgi:hypothetical protein
MAKPRLAAPPDPLSESRPWVRRQCHRTTLDCPVEALGLFLNAHQQVQTLDGPQPERVALVSGDYRLAETRGTKTTGDR